MTTTIPYGNQLYELTGQEYAELEDILESKPDDEYETVVYHFLITKGYAVEAPSSEPLPVRIDDRITPRVGRDNRDVWTKERILREREKLITQRERMLERRARTLRAKPVQASFFQIFSFGDLVKAAIMTFLLFCLLMAYCGSR